LDEWSLHVEEEDAECAFSRLLIAFDELRARLAPSKYPNLEISDEGHLWFNVETSVGTIEVIALPFGYKEIKHPSLLVSFPCKAEEVNLGFLSKLHQISNSFNGAKLFAGFSTDQKILDAYRQNRHPPLVCSGNFDEILEMKRQGVFFSYLGICFSVIGKTVSEVEQTIREILLKLEGKVGVLSE
jgi:hypothetical protein